MPNAFGVIPCLGHDTRRLEQHAQQAQRWIKANSKFRLEAKSLGTEAVTLFDPMFGVAAIATHIPLADRAGWARNRIGVTHDADNEISRRKLRPVRHLLDATQRFVAED